MKANFMRILIVEDDQETAAALKAELEAERYSVDVEHDGVKASYRARTTDYDLILLDNMLPGKQGPEICSELREYKMHVPVLILSAQSETDKKVGLLNCGADDYVTKPYSLQEVSARVRALLRRPRGIEPSKLVSGGITLDRSNFTVYRGKQQIDLTPKEFSLLEFLMKHQSRVVSRGAILEHVWDGDADPFSNTIEAHIHNLRSKINVPGRSTLIRTLPGRGYQFG